MERLLDVRQLTHVLSVSRYSIYKWVAQGRLPFLKLGTRLLFHPDQIQRWVREHSRCERQREDGATRRPAGVRAARRAAARTGPRVGG